MTEPDSGRRVPVGPEPAGEPRELMVNVLGGSERRGVWSPPRKLVVVTTAGEEILDYREATLTGSEVEVRVVSLLGATTILVPPGFRVEMEGMPILGKFEYRSEGAAPEGDSPLLRVTGVALLGQVTVIALPPGEPFHSDS